MSDLYPPEGAGREGAGKAIRFTQITAILFSCIVLFFPARISDSTVDIYRVFSILVLLTNASILIRAALRKREGARLLLLCL
ncbi:MAG: hypothetical protein JRJ85_06635 [Deltaproteobacteria bacterium]|nr:hypothetical protein [Deltaproteobacteria bacterium]